MIASHHRTVTQHPGAGGTIGGVFQLPDLDRYGFWAMAHEARTDFPMSLVLAYLLGVGGGRWLPPRPGPAGYLARSSTCVGPPRRSR